MQPNSLQSMYEAVKSHLQAGRNQQAAEVLGEIVRLFPREPQAPFMLGVLFHQAGQSPAALDWLIRSIRLNPENAEAHFLCGIIYQSLNRFTEAADAYRQSLARKPGNGKALNNLGRAVLDSGDIGQAIAILNQAVKTSPPNPAAHTNLGAALRMNGDPDAAAEHYRKAISIDEKCAEAHGNLGVVLAGQGRVGEAIVSIRRAIELNPRMYNPRFNLAKILHESMRMNEAHEQVHAALQIRPTSAEAHNLLGNLLGITGQISQCIAAQRRAVELKPDFAAAHSNLLLSLHYLPDLAPQDLFAAHQQWAMQQTRGLMPINESYANDRTADRRLRVGYVSPNFNAHSVAYFFEPVLAAHDRKQFEIFCYSDLPSGDQTTDRLKTLADHWREIAGKADEAVSGMIRQDAIDILVDLAGHTSGNRMPMFARKPAPVQITWLGYPDTTGLKTMDYRVTDAIADPPGASDPFHTEKLIRIPGGAWSYQAAQGPDIGPSPASANGFVTFGSFNNLPKVTHTALQCWARILQKVPRSRLILKSSGLSSQMGREQAAGHLTRNGIEPGRFELLGWLPTTFSHLELYNRIDIALDTFPYNGTTTTCEALWMGVPVITFSGSSHVSRVGTSLLTHANCPEWIAADLNGYVDLAVQMANQLPDLAAARSTLRDRLKTSALCDGKRMAGELETVYRQTWAAFCDPGNHK
jgi:protein O-GlcNAc transferase